jgi:hypothetical protein
MKPENAALIIFYFLVSRLILYPEVNFFLELAPLLDPVISEEELNLLKSNFESYKVFVKDELYHSLDGSSDETEIQLRMQKARNELARMCYDYLYSHYQQTKPHLLQELQHMKPVQDKMQKIREMDERLNDRLSKMSNSAGVTTSSSPSSSSSSAAAASGASTADVSTHGGTGPGFPSREISSGWEWYGVKDRVRDWLSPRSLRARFSPHNVYSVLARRAPIIRWLPLYFNHGLCGNFKYDLLAALTIGFMLIPQVPSSCFRYFVQIP